MKFVFGLGNPGEKYRNTRHNAGYDVLCRVAAFFQVELKKRCIHKYSIAETEKAKLIFPLTYMNNSGDVVKCFKIYNPSDLVVICDNMDLACGGLRIKQGGGSSGQKGLASVAQVMNSQDFVRIYVGIGRPNVGEEVVDYVLGRERDSTLLSAYNEALDAAAKAVEEYIEGESIANIQCKYNRKGIC